jgi:signal transduction histidine kinase
VFDSTPVPRGNGAPQKSTRLVDATGPAYPRVAAAGPAVTRAPPDRHRDAGAIADLLAISALTLPGAEGAIVARLEDSHFRVAAAAGSLVPMLGVSGPIAGSIAADVLATARAVVLHTAVGDPRADALLLAAFAPRQIVLAPLVVDRAPGGFLLVMHSGRGAFPADAGERLQRLAEQGAVALGAIAEAARAEARSRDEQRLSGVISEINQSLELERVLALAAQHAAALLGGRGARVMLLEGATLVLAARHGVTGDDERASRVAAPLLVGGRVIGALTVFGLEGRTAHDVGGGERDLVLLQALADHAAVAIENARLYRAAAQTARHASVLAATARGLALSTDAVTVYAGLSEIVHGALGGCGFVVVIADQQTRVARVVYEEGEYRLLPCGPHGAFWESPARGVMASQRARYVSEVEELIPEWTADRVAAVRAAGVRSLAILPLTSEHSTRGLLSIRFAGRHRFDDPERRLLEDFTTQVAIAVRNTELAAAEARGRERERVLAEAMHQTEKLAALGELVAGVAHELNNPLTGISVLAQLLLDEAMPEGQLESVRMIRRESDRAVRVIRDLLDFARKSGPQHVAIDATALVEQTLRLRAYALQSAGIVVDAAFDEALPTVAGDYQKLQQVLLNLIVNAEYAMQHAERRVLTIRTRGDVDGLRIEVGDTGSGMASDVAKHVFDPFFTTKPVGVGTGLGLSVSYGIVAAHGGSIAVESAPGEGAVFTVTLPIGTVGALPA